MNYDEQIEVELDSKLREKTRKLISLFFENIRLSPDTFKNGKFKIWSDSHNSKFIYMDGDVFIYECCFLHEHYVTRVTNNDIFKQLKEKYRGIEHFEVDVMRLK